MRWAQRSAKKELLDELHIPFSDIECNMREMEVINRLLGGHSTTLMGVRRILLHVKEPLSSLHIAEMGCGNGNNLYRISKWSKSTHLQVEFTGIDLADACIQSAKSRCGKAFATWVVAPYQEVSWPTEQRPDIIFSSLFCHHFSTEQLVEQLHWMHQNCKRGFFINDLHRHPMAYYGIAALTQLCSRSYLVKHDAPLSVLRGFRKKEWKELLQRAGIERYQITWHPVFRHLITVVK